MHNSSKEQAPIIWLTGISGSGKTTLGKQLTKKLEKRYKKVAFIDGDVVRAFFENDLGFTRNDRIMNVKRISFAAALLAQHGTPVVVANIAPYFEVRDFLRRHLNNYHQVYLRTSVEAVIERDVKGHYQKYQKGELTNLIGLDDPYEAPRNPDLILDTDTESQEESFQNLQNFLAHKGIL